MPFDPLFSAYEVRQYEKNFFSSRWIGPHQFDHGKDMLIAEYPGIGDGQAVRVFCCAMPARFYRIQIQADQPKGVKRPGYTINTGSSCGELAAQIAEAISNGLLEFVGS